MVSCNSSALWLNVTDSWFTHVANLTVVGCPAVHVMGSTVGSTFIHLSNMLVGEYRRSSGKSYEVRPQCPCPRPSSSPKIF